MSLAAVVNDATKWAVSVAVFSVVVWQRNLVAVWGLLGALGNAAMCKMLKRAIDQPRPEGATKDDGGMPSSHAASLAFISIYFHSAMSTSVDAPNDAGVGWQILPSTVILGLFVVLAMLRVVCGFHTWSQVSVGYALGGAGALTWHGLGKHTVLPVLGKADATILCVVTAAVALRFAQRLIGSKLGTMLDTNGGQKEKVKKRTTSKDA